MDGFCDVLFRDMLAGFEIGEGPGDSEYFVVGAGAEAHLGHDVLHEGTCGLVEGAMGADAFRVEVGVAGKCAVIPCALAISRGLDL